MPTDACLLDTHALAWWKADELRLSAKARRAIHRATTVHVAAISAWEVEMLVQKGRLRFDRDTFAWLRDLEEEGVVFVPLDERIAVHAARLAADGFGGDPADQIICATASKLGIPLVTKDARITDFAAARRDLRVVW
jgi:PIN domain nuclease of toxin-antitoxin system